jgi:5-oxoprolinase (ATP-hydrolysing)
MNNFSFGESNKQESKLSYYETICGGGGAGPGFNGESGV